MAAKPKTYEARGVVEAVNRKDPRKLGLLLRNADGVEKWFTLWKGKGDLPQVEEGDTVEFSYVVKPGRNGGDPFLNIIDLEVTGKSEEGSDDSQDQERAVEIRAAVALKAAASSGLAAKGDEVLELAEQFFNWLDAKIGGRSS